VSIRGRPRLFTPAQSQQMAAEWDAGSPIKALVAKYGASDRTIWNYVRVYVPRETTSNTQAENKQVSA